jgi:DNA-binding NtrC family response regulator
LPPLRERREDIPLLSEHFLTMFAPDKKISSSCIQLLMGYDWPGNIRELQNTIQSAAVMAGDDEINTMHLSASVVQSWPKVTTETALKNETTSSDLDTQIRDFEKAMLIQALTQSLGVQKQAAKLLNIKERSLWHRLKKYDIDASSFKM